MIRTIWKKSFQTGPSSLQGTGPSRWFDSFASKKWLYQSIRSARGFSILMTWTGSFESKNVVPDHTPYRRLSHPDDQDNLQKKSFQSEPSSLQGVGPSRWFDSFASKKWSYKTTRSARGFSILMIWTGSFKSKNVVPDHMLCRRLSPLVDPDHLQTTILIMDCPPKKSIQVRWIASKLLYIRKIFVKG